MNTLSTSIPQIDSRHDCHTPGSSRRFPLQSSPFQLLQHSSSECPPSPNPTICNVHPLRASLCYEPEALEGRPSIKTTDAAVGRPKLTRTRTSIASDLTSFPNNYRPEWMQRGAGCAVALKVTVVHP